jgi:hypothetical protein
VKQRFSVSKGPTHLSKTAANRTKPARAGLRAFVSRLTSTGFCLPHVKKTATQYKASTQHGQQQLDRQAATASARRPRRAIRPGANRPAASAAPRLRANYLEFRAESYGRKSPP